VVRRALPARRVPKVHRVRGARRAIRARLVLPARPGLLGRLAPKARRATEAKKGIAGQRDPRAKQRLPLPPSVYRSTSALPVAAVLRAAGLKNSS
jgi:hypothetical protein